MARVRAGAKEMHLRTIFGENLRTARQAAGMSQHAFAAASAGPQNQISMLENAKISIGLDRLARVCRVLNLEPNELPDSQFKQRMGRKVNKCSKCGRRQPPDN